MTSSRKLGRCPVLELEVPLLLLSRGVAALHHQLGRGVAGGGRQAELQGGKRKYALCCAQCNNCTWYSTTISTKTQRNVLSTTKKAELNVAQFRALDSSAGEFFFTPSNRILLFPLYLAVPVPESPPLRPVPELRPPSAVAGDHHHLLKKCKSGHYQYHAFLLIYI